MMLSSLLYTRYIESLSIKVPWLSHSVVPSMEKTYLTAFMCVRVEEEGGFTPELQPSFLGRFGSTITDPPFGGRKGERG